MRPAFIVFEGGEGTGKSTQTELLGSYLGAVVTREPGGTPVGQKLRELLLDPTESVEARSEALMMAAARAQHVDTVIRPALNDGKHVVCDRYVHSSLAYQGVARGLGIEPVSRLNEWAMGSLWPDMVVYLEVDDEALAERRTQRAVDDRFESEEQRFHAAVNQAFESFAETDTRSTWVRVDGLGAPEEVAGRVRAAVDEYLSSRNS